MLPLTRRSILQLAAFGPVTQPFAIAAPPSTDIRLKAVDFRFEDFRYRTPYKFGGVLVDRATLLHVNSVLEDPLGRNSRGFGSMPLGNVWSFPSKVLDYDTTLGAMKTLAKRVSGILSDYREFGHPVDIGVALEPQYLQAAQEIRLAEPVPKLCTLVTASPFDGAVHVAYGKLHRVNCYHTYGSG